MMLQDTGAIKRLAQRDAGLVGKILAFLKEFARRLKRALEGVTATSTEAQALMDVRDGVERYVEELQDAWDDAAVEAAQNGRKRGTVEVRKGATAEGGKQYAIRTLQDGRQYVEDSRSVISGTDPTKWRTQIINFINKTIRAGKDVTVYASDGTPLTITRDTAGKAAYRNAVKNQNGTAHPLSDFDYAIKLRAESHIDELAAVSYGGERVFPDSGKHRFAKDGFTYRTVYWKDSTGYYRLTLSVGKNGSTNTIYNIGKIEKAQFPGSEVNETKVHGSSKAQVGNKANDIVQEFDNSVKSYSDRTSAPSVRQYSYAGRGSRTRDKSRFDQAQELEENGASNEDIRQQTGWFKGMDGQWRYEIDDSKATIVRIDMDRVMMLSDMMEHPDLFEAYPELKSTPIIFTDLPDGTVGRAVGRGIMLSRNHFSEDGLTVAENKELLRTLLHELQHQIQRIEGFTRGSNWRYWQEKLDEGLRIGSGDAGIRKAERTRSEYFDKLSNEMKSLIRQRNQLILDQKEQELLFMEAESAEAAEAAWNRASQLQEQIAEIGDKALQLDPSNDALWTYDMMTEAIRRAKANNHQMTSRELYRMTAGEIEARDVESRMGLNESQRRQLPPANDVNAVFVEHPSRRQFSLRETANMSWEKQLKTADTRTLPSSSKNNHLLTPAEYSRLQSNLNSQKYGNVFLKRPNGGVVVAMDNLLVYTDRKGTPEYVVEVPDYDIWLVNDVQQLLMQLEGDGTDHETQRIILESVYGTEGAHFRSRGERANSAGEDRKGTRSIERGMGEGDREEVPPEITEHSDRTPAPSLRQTLAAMEMTPYMNETESVLLEGYKKNVAELAEKQEQIRRMAAVLSIDSVSAEEKAKARERLKIFRSQARRIEKRLRLAEQNEGFASLMRTSRGLVRERQHPPDGCAGAGAGSMT